MWFRGVAASMGLCFNISTVLESYSNVVLTVDGDEVNHRQPVCLPELRQRLPTPQVLQVGLDLVPLGHALGNQVGNFGVSSLGLIEASNQTIVALLIFSLFKGHMCGLADAFIDEFCRNIDFSLKFSKFAFKRCSIKAL